MPSTSLFDDYFQAESDISAKIDAYRRSLKQDEHPAEFDIYDLTYEYNGIDCVCEDIAYYNFDPAKLKNDIEKSFALHGKTFSERVLEIIRIKSLNEITVYKRAHLDRKLFSKLRSNIYYKPSRNTALALVLALELNLDEAEELLKSAGFALSGTTLEDIIVEYFIVHHIYSILSLNETLYAFGLPLLSE